MFSSFLRQRDSNDFQKAAILTDILKMKVGLNKVETMGNLNDDVICKQVPLSKDHFNNDKYKNIWFQTIRQITSFLIISFEMVRNKTND